MKKIITLLLCLCTVVAIDSCKKNNNNSSPANAPTITADQQDLMPLQIATLNTDNITLKSPSYNGAFDGKTVVLTVMDNKMGFILPDGIGTGTYKLTANIEGQQIDISYNIIAAPVIADPNQYMTTYSTACENTLTTFDKMDTLIAGMPGAADYAENKVLLEESYTEFKSLLNTATPEEKKQLALFIASNPDLFAPYGDISKLYNPSFSIYRTTADEEFPEDRKKSWATLIKEKVTRLKKGVTEWATVQSNNFNNITGISLLKSISKHGVLVGLYDEATTQAVAGHEAALQTGDPELNGYTGNKQFENGAEQNLEVSSDYRTYNKNDVGSEDQSITTTLYYEDQFTSTWNYVSDKLVKKLKGIPYNIRNAIPTDKVKKFLVKPGNMLIENISNSKVNITVDNSTPKLKVKVVTSEPTTQNFDFDLVYKADDGTQKKVTVHGQVVSGRSGETFVTGSFVSISGVGENIYLCEFNGIRKWAIGETSSVSMLGGGYYPNDIYLKNGYLYYLGQLDYSWNKVAFKMGLGSTTGVPVSSGYTATSGVGLSGISVDNDNNVYVVNLRQNRVDKWTPGNTTSSVVVAGGHGEGSALNQLYLPGDIFVDNSKNIYLPDATPSYGSPYGSRVVKWAPGATSGVIVAGGNGDGDALNQLKSPQAVFVDLAGNVYVADYGNDRVMKWAPGATSGVIVAGGNGKGSAANQLSNPIAIYVKEPSGDIYIVDQGNNRVQKWKQ